MPSYAVDGTGKIHRAPEDVKNIYLTEGTLFLKKKLKPPGPEGKDERKYPEPPDLSKERGTEEKETKNNILGNQRPKWWNQAYDRKAKNIPSRTWQDLTRGPSPSEVLETISIRSSGNNQKDSE